MLKTQIPIIIYLVPSRKELLF